MTQANPLLFVDIETTGASPRRARILELAALRYERGRVVDRLVTLIDPSEPVPWFITRLTGIKHADIAGKPDFSQVADEFLRLAKGAVFVAHNVWFDYRFLRTELLQVGVDYIPELACTVQLSRRLYPKERSHRLDAVVERHGIIIDDRHRAEGDARAIVEFYERAIEQYGEDLVWKTLRPLRPLTHQL